MSILIIIGLCIVSFIIGFAISSFLRFLRDPFDWDGQDFWDKLTQ